MSFRVDVIEDDEPFVFKFGTSVERAFRTIHQSYPDIRGRFRVVPTVPEAQDVVEDLDPAGSFPDDNINKNVVFIPAKELQPKTGK